MNAKVELRGQLEVVTYPQKLLSTATALLDSGEFSIAVVVSHMACELAIERTLSEAFAARGIGDLRDPIAALLSGYNLANGRVRKLYTALTGDEIQKQPFWEQFTKSAMRRNAVVHSGRIVSKLEAAETLEVTGALVSHLKL